MRMTYLIRSLLLAFFLMAVSGASFAQVSVGISVGFGPPALPVYAQPICPGDGYIWTPGYWAWDPAGGDYYWVPGTWVLAPQVGYFWTPGWWGWGGSAFLWHVGYWGPHVGFYGGINYGFGYFGTGFVGGRWDGGHFFYNREVSNVNVTVIHNVYNEHIVNNYSNTHISYNGGQGGINQRATAEEERYDSERHIAPVAAQNEHVEAARNNPQLRASYNKGKPPIAATARPGEFTGHDVEEAKEAGGHYEPPANHGNEAGGAAHNAVHPSELPPLEHMSKPNTGDANMDQKYQQQQDKLYQKQNQDRQKLQQQQEKEHQQLEKQNASEAQKQQVEQKHQQQTQHMVQQHAQQQQQLQQKQQSHSSSHH